MRVLTVYEHRAYKAGELAGDGCFNSNDLICLQRHYERNSRFYSLIQNGVRFCEYVGVLKLEGLCIEILPKADGVADGEGVWRLFLIKMLKASGDLNVSHTGYTPLSFSHHSILDVYIELFLQEVQYLMQHGLVKKYAIREGNTLALKGALLFSKNIQQNLVHAERFYVRYTVYDKDNSFNGILRQTLKLITRIGNVTASAKANAILLDYPTCREVRLGEGSFKRLIYDRKTERYKKAINIAKQLLLNYHPDVRRGSEDVLALMFDMNKLWERYVFNRLRKALEVEHAGKYIVKEQVVNHFWKPTDGYLRTVRPDIVVYKTNDDTRPVAVLDTKWKMLKNDRPDDTDLKQMLIYNLYNDVKASALVYPSNGRKDAISGIYQKGGHKCSLLFLPIVRVGRSLGLDMREVIRFIEECCSDSKLAS